MLLHSTLNRATSKIFKEFFGEKFPSAILNQTIRDVNSQKKYQQARTFKKMWCSLNNQNLKVEKNGDFYTVSFPTLGKRVCAGSGSALQAKVAGSDHRGCGQARNGEAL
jgi:putative transposase